MSNEILGELQDAVVAGNAKKAKKVAEQVIGKGKPVSTAIDTLMKAMKIVDQRYERREYFVIDVASSALAMREAFRVLEPYLEVEPAMVKGKIVIGSLKGNLQGLGKDIVAATLQAAGFQVVNLGVDISPEEFVEAAVKEKAQIIAVSVSMEETVPYLKDLVEILKKKGLRGKVKVIIGGNAVSDRTRRNYGLDAYAADAQECLKRVNAMLI